MDSEHPGGRESAPKSDTGMRRPTRADARESVMQGRPVVGTTRLIVDAGILGFCVVFLAAMLGVRPLDQPLTVALMAVAIAIPLVVCGYIFGSYRFERGPVALFLRELGHAAQVLATVGEGAAVVGLIAVFEHVYPAAAWIFMGTALLCLPLVISLASARMFVNHWRTARQQEAERKREAAAKGGAVTPASDEVEGTQRQAPTSPQ
jgi:hypothetical protein